MRRLAGAVAALAVCGAPAVAQQTALLLSERLGSLVKVGGANGTVAATYSALPAGPGMPLATVYDRPLARTAAEDMAANEEALRVVAGVTAPGVPLAATGRCPDLLGRIDHGRVDGGETITASLFARVNGRNVKLRVTAPVARGEPFVRAIVVEFERKVLGC